VLVSSYWEAIQPQEPKVSIMKTSNTQALLAAFQVACEKCNQHKEQEEHKRSVAEMITDNDIEYIERKLNRIVKSLNGSRYKDVSKELKILVEMIDL